MIIKRGTSEDVAALAQPREMPADRLGEFAAWIDAHAETHFPYLAEVDGVPVGSAWLLVAERVPGGGSFDRRYGDVQAVFVLEEYRGRGIGAALIAAILDEARTLGLLHVTVHSGRRAVDFYLRTGFRHDRQLLYWDHNPSADQGIAADGVLDDFLHDDKGQGEQGAGGPHRHV